MYPFYIYIFIDILNPLFFKSFFPLFMILFALFLNLEVYSWFFIHFLCLFFHFCYLILYFYLFLIVFVTRIVYRETQKNGKSELNVHTHKKLLKGNWRGKQDNQQGMHAFICQSCITLENRGFFMEKLELHSLKTVPVSQFLSKTYNPRKICKYHQPRILNVEKYQVHMHH